MPIYRLATAVNFNSALPRDAMMINPTFDDKGVTTNPNNLATDMANLIKTFCSITTSGQVQVKVYDATQHPHGPAKATVVLNPGTFANQVYPSELAVCLSFFSDYNVKRRRGRLYVPLAWLGSAAIGQRPSAANITKVATLPPLLASLGGADVDWVVYSKTDNAARKVSNWWVDDEWDIQRMRGLRPTTRTTGTTGG